MGIKRNHAKFENINGSISIIPYDEECADYLFVNGEKKFQKSKWMVKKWKKVEKHTRNPTV